MHIECKYETNIAHQGAIMPINEYRGITLKKSVVEKLEIIAIQTKRTVPKVIEHMLETQYPEIEIQRKKTK
jgi:hypothetical protein